jgi:hypothetical protein
MQCPLAVDNSLIKSTSQNIPPDCTDNDEDVKTKWRICQQNMGLSQYPLLKEARPELTI